MVGDYPEIDERFRSLLQKAVRRGNEDLVVTVSALLASLGPEVKGWYRPQSAVIVFQECWPLGAELLFNKRFYSKVAALVKAARSSKSRDAAGLGYLAQALSEGDPNVLDGSTDDRDLKILAKAVRAPEDFWRWIQSLTLSPAQETLAARAHRFRKAGYQRDRVVLQAAAYLAATLGVTPPQPGQPAESKFPYWVVFDHHTRLGNRVLRDIARDLHIPLHQLEWASYYFEGAVTGADTPSRWWEKYCSWHFRKVGLPPEEAHLLWEPARPQVVEALAEESHRLQGEIYRWKMANLEAVDGLRRKVELFIAHFDEMQPDQMVLF